MGRTAAVPTAVNGEKRILNLIIGSLMTVVVVLAGVLVSGYQQTMSDHVTSTNSILEVQRQQAERIAAIEGSCVRADGR